MADRSAIEWTDATWNPWRGCDKVSPGCAHCYMFRDQRRYGRDPSVVVRAAEPTFRAPLGWAEGRMVFTCSWSDWFHEDADGWREEAWDVVRATPRHTYQVLTKRADRIAEHLPADWGDGWPNVWLGVSVENRRFVDRVDALREVPAAVRFVSAEPLLGPVIARFERDGALGEWVWPDGKVCMEVGTGLFLHGIDWVIAGGESGPGARPMRVEWVRDLRDACAEMGTAFFFKQWGGPRPGGPALLDGREWRQMPTPRDLRAPGALL